MVLRKQPPPPRKLCPRCGSPMLSEEGVKSCPVCHFCERTVEKTTIGVKISDEVMYKPVSKEEGSQIKIFKMVHDDMVKTDCLDSNDVCLIADIKQTKIWIWKGKFTSPGEVYRAGTAATRLKTSEKMYGAQTHMVEEENEPTDFPSVKRPKDEVIIKQKPEVKEPEAEKEEVKPEVKEVEVKVKEPEAEEKEVEPEIKEIEFEAKEPETEVKETEAKEIKNKVIEFEIAELGKDKEIITRKTTFEIEK